MEEWNKEDLYSSSFRQMNKKEKLIWLMDEYGQTVMRLAFTYVRDKQIAEDIAQGVFIKCFEIWMTLKRNPLIGVLPGCTPIMIYLKMKLSLKSNGKVTNNYH